MVAERPAAARQTSAANASPTSERPVARLALMAVAFIFLAIFLLLPLVIVFEQGFSRGIGKFVESIAEPDTLSAIRLTLLVAFISVGLNLLFGVIAAWAITKFEFPGKTFLVTLIDLPFSVSPVVAGLALVLLFGANSAIGGWLVAAGFPIIFALPGIDLLFARRERSRRCFRCGRGRSRWCHRARGRPR